MTADRLDITLDAVNQELARLHLTGDVDADLTPEQKRDRLELHAAEGRVCSAKYRDQAGIGALMPDLSKLNPEEQAELLKLLEHDEVIEPPTIVFSVNAPFDE